MIARLDLLPTNSVGDVRVTQPVEDYQVQLLLGLDNVAYMPKEMEMGKYTIEGGQLILFQSFISGSVLPSRSRCTGYKSTMKYGGGQ